MKLKDLRKLIQKELNNIDENSWVAIDCVFEQIEDEYGIEAKNKAVRDFKLDES